MSDDQLMKQCETCNGSGAVTREFTDDEFEDYLTEIYGQVDVCGYKWDAGHLLNKIDPIAFSCAMSECEDEEDCPDCDGIGEVDA